jgi:L-ribulose-5-phosphate 3-epimerase
VSDEYLIDYADAGLYTMQGRLTSPERGLYQFFPRTNWQREMELTKEVPLRGIEWVYDMHGQGANPIETVQGRSEFLKKKMESSVSVVSICANYFMECPLFGVSGFILNERLAKLKWLISICSDLRISRIVLPFFDDATISATKDFDGILFALNDVLPAAVQYNVELHLETDLNPTMFRSLLDEIKSPFVKVNYDSGNSGAMGYSPREEFDAYGDRIGSFHIKDRVQGGGTVKLGCGDADFTALRAALLDIDYRGDFVLEVARGIPGDELNGLKSTTVFAENWLRGGKVS